MNQYIIKKLIILALIIMKKNLIKNLNKIVAKLLNQLNKIKMILELDLVMKIGILVRIGKIQKRKSHNFQIHR